MVTDHGSPLPCEVSRNATVKVKVFRNLNTPLFSEGGVYTATVKEDRGVNNRVTQVRAQDKDNRVCNL